MGSRGIEEHHQFFIVESLDVFFPKQPFVVGIG